MFLRQSTMSQEVVLGVFVDETDGFTAEASLTIANTDIKVWKAGATTLANKNSGGATHISGGMYSAVLDATDTSTLGNLEVIVHKGGARPVQRAYVVLPPSIYDALIGGSLTEPTGPPSLPLDPAAALAWAAFFSGTPINERVQKPDVQELKNNAGSIIAEKPITLVSGVSITHGKVETP